MEVKGSKSKVLEAGETVQYFDYAKSSALLVEWVQGSGERRHRKSKGNCLDHEESYTIC